VTVKVYKPSVDSSKNAWISDLDQYQKLYDESVKNPDEFWAGIAERIPGQKNGIKYVHLILLMQISNSLKVEN